MYLVELDNLNIESILMYDSLLLLCRSIFAFAYKYNFLFICNSNSIPNSQKECQTFIILGQKDDEA
jgi:hypothetical protein